MHAFYTKENLQSRLGSLSLPTRDGFHGSGRGILRQDNSLVGVPFEAILARTGDLGKVTTDSVSAMVLRLLALMLDDEFQAISKVATDAHNGTFKATEPKGHPRMMNKALSRDDHLLELSPRTMMNIDIVRNALTFDTVEDLTGAVGQLRQTLGDPVRVKNMFAFHKQRAEAQFHYRTLMINWLYDAQCTFRDLVERPQNVELLDTFKEAAPWNPNEPWCRWRRHAHLAVEILKGRQKMHLLYKVYRASDETQLYLDFKPKEREARTWRWCRRWWLPGLV
uniref:Uncharacterized protein n=1 Tax=Rhizochromulina marina TaxID=1034831 RepID=A0A7S2W0T9_9STRA|mmetsp:Transcript_10441/g.29856  ORF Transcript_10441/g.29856 Transcript_10441/m.29856 type:complete len:280 (+) Transcript_10441:894-1733(+)